jgi:hypothetical protein
MEGYIVVLFNVVIDNTSVKLLVSKVQRSHSTFYFPKVD